MKKFLVFAAAILLLGAGYISAQDKTSQMGIGVYDLIIKNTNFTKAACETHTCNLVSDDNNIKVAIKRVGFDLFLNRDLNIIMDVNVDSILFNCEEEAPCKSGLIVHYHNDVNLIRVYIKNSDHSIEASTNGEVRLLNNWLKILIDSARAS